MSSYKNTTQISPSTIYAELKIELKSYFSSGAMDDLMFGRWTEEALDKISRGTYEIKETYLRIKNFQVKLPENFKYVRELWACYTTSKINVQSPSSVYTQYTCRVNPKRTENEDRCDPCEDCYPSDFTVTYKTTGEFAFSFSTSHLLKPGNVNCQNKCSQDCINRGSNSLDSFDIRDGKLVTNFKEGDLLLIYYAYNEDEDGYRTIPDEHYVKEFVKDYIRFKLFEMLFNSTTDETFNQTLSKLQYYEARMYDSKANCEVDTKKWDIYDLQKSILKSYHSLDRFEIGF